MLLTHAYAHKRARAHTHTHTRDARQDLRYCLWDDNWPWWCSFAGKMSKFEYEDGMTMDLGVKGGDHTNDWDRNIHMTRIEA